MTPSTVCIFGLCAISVLLSNVQVATAVKCFVCPGNKLTNCASTKDFKEKTKYEEFNCTAGCGKLVSWNPKPPTQKNYVGLRDTVRSLEYKYCAPLTSLGCTKSESAVTINIECVCSTDSCNQAGCLTAGFWTLTVPVMLACWVMAA